MQVIVKRTGIVFRNYEVTATGTVNGTDIEVTATARDRDIAIDEAVATYNHGRRFALGR